jgi:CRP/FNR family transcriptional regulator, nitrogen oxide reductase regulator
MHQNHAGRVSDLDGSEIFNGLKSHEIEVIRNAALERRFKDSEVLVTAEQTAQHFFLLKSGLVDYRVNTKDGREILLRRLTAGDAFGFAALLSKPVGYLGTATSARETEALVWESAVIHKLTLSYPRLMENALRLGLHYISLYAKRHIALVSTPARERVACALTKLASRTGHAIPVGMEVDVKNKDLASLADVNSYSVSRFLKQWDRDGAVKKSRGKILLRCPEHLLS